MKWWLTTLILTTTIAVGSAQTFSIQWLSFVRNGGAPVPIRINPLNGLIDLAKGVTVDSRFPSVTADGTRVVFQVGSENTAQIWEAAFDPNLNQWQSTPVLDPNTNQPLLGLHPVISADGNHIAFASTQDYGFGSNGRQQIYILDRTQNRIVPISVLWWDNPDNDSDGRVDEDPVNGIDDDADGVTDEDPPGGDGIRDVLVPNLGNCIPVYVSSDGRIVMFLVEWLPDDNLNVPNHPAIDPLGNDHPPQNAESRLCIVDADGDGRHEPVPIPPTNQPNMWLLLIHDRDADGNGIYDEAGIGSTRTFVGSYDWDWRGKTAVISSVSSINVSANGRFITYTVPLPFNPQDPNDPNANRWTVVVRDWQVNSDNPQKPDDVGILLRISYLAPRFCDAYQPTLSDDGSYLVFFMPVQDDDGDGRLDEDPVNGRDDDGDGRIDEDDIPLYPDNDGDGQVDEDPVDNSDNDNDGLIDEDPVDPHLNNDGDIDPSGNPLIDEDPLGDADGDGNSDDDGDGRIDEDPPSPPYTQTPMELVALRISDRSLLRLSQLFTAPPLLGTSGYGYSDWWGAATIAVDPQNPDIAYVAFHSWATNLIDLQNILVRDNDGDGRADEDPINGVDDDKDGQVDEDPPDNFYQGVPNIFVARFDFTPNAANPIQLWQLTPGNPPQPTWGPRALPVSLERNVANTYRLPLAASLMPTVSFVNGRQLFVVFQSLAPFDQSDTNGLWDIYIATVPLP